MSNNNKTPDLSTLADIEMSFDDLDSIIANEAQGVESNSMPQPTNTGNTPTVGGNTSNNNQPQMPAVDPYQEEMTKILEQETSESYTDTTKHYLEDDNHFNNDDYQMPADNNQQPQQPQGANQPTEDQNQTNNDQEADPYEIAFDLLQEMDLIRLPEGITNLNAEEIEYYKEQTLIDQREEALHYLRSRVQHDPKMLDLFDYVMDGAEYADLPTYRALTEVEIDYENANIEDVNVQKDLVYQYLRNGLDVNDPKNKEIIEFIPDKIEKLEDTNKLKEKALVAREYFVNLVRERKQQERQRALQQKEAYEREQELLYQQNLEWDRLFRQSLTQRKWSDAKKNAVVKENTVINLEDGSQLPLWEYKRQIIFNDPYLFQQFLDFTASFDLNSGDFKGSAPQGQPQDNSAINKILERALKKSQDKRGSAVNRAERFIQNDNKQKPVANPYQNEWFD
jgi:hypothetical protein